MKTGDRVEFIGKNLTGAPLIGKIIEEFSPGTHPFYLKYQNDDFVKVLWDDGSSTKTHKENLKSC